MNKALLFTAPLFGAAIIWANSAHALPSEAIDRAIACSVYGGFAPNGDPLSAPTKRIIDRIVQDAIASGARTQQQVSDAFNDEAQLAIYDAPREDLIANWRECRDEFAPRSVGS